MNWRILGILLLISTIGCTGTRDPGLDEPRTINPKYYVLESGDVPGNLVLNKAAYSDIKGKVGSPDYELLSQYNYTESFSCWYYNEERTPSILNAVIRFSDRASAGNMITYTRDQVIAGEGNYKDATILEGEDYGESSVYFFYNGTLPYYTAEIQAANYVIRLSLFGSDVELADLYPYLEVLVKRVSDDDRIIPLDETD